MISHTLPDQTDMEIAVGLDPGSRIAGIGIVKGVNGRLEYIGHFPIRIPDALSQAEKLVFFANTFENVIKSYSTASLVIESLFTAKNINSILKVSHFRGVAMMMAARHGWQVLEIAPATVKMSVTGYGRATKEQVRFMVQKMLRLREPPAPLDCSDALALAICHLGQTRFRKRIRKRL